jgi:hypothetical protein
MQMKTVLKCFLIFSFPWILWSCGSGAKTGLFNGNDLDNWEISVGSDEVEPVELFWVEDGTITTSGQPNGYIRTKGIYSNYKLHVEWRWLDEPTNSGVLLNIQDQSRGWKEFPLCIECQLQHGNAGDIVCIGRGAGITIRDSTYLVESEDGRPMAIGKTEADSEHAPGEWNSYDITCRNGSIEVKVNGVLQNAGEEMTLHEGHIGLQSEGSPLQFRKLTLESL